jgi:SAM-dependent methyltransferase
MQWFVENYLRTDKKLKVLDVGSMDVNGSYKHLFPSDKFEYIGLDMAPGNNVDLVLSNPYNWNEIKNDSFDIIVSGQAFEHIEFFWLTMSEMTRVLKKNGLMCIIAPNGFGEHRHPVDCYRFFTDGMVSLARYVNLEVLHAHTNLAPNKKLKEWYSKKTADSMLVAKKNYSNGVKFVNTKNYKCIPINHSDINSGFVVDKKPRKRFKYYQKAKYFIKGLF